MVPANNNVFVSLFEKDARTACTAALQDIVEKNEHMSQPH